MWHQRTNCIPKNFSTGLVRCHCYYIVNSYCFSMESVFAGNSLWSEWDYLTSTPHIYNDKANEYLLVWWMKWPCLCTSLTFHPLVLSLVWTIGNYLLLYLSEYLELKGWSSEGLFSCWTCRSNLYRLNISFLRIIIFILIRFMNKKLFKEKMEFYKFPIDSSPDHKKEA